VDVLFAGSDYRSNHTKYAGAADFYEHYVCKFHFYRRGGAGAVDDACRG